MRLMPPTPPPPGAGSRPALAAFAVDEFPFPSSPSSVVAAAAHLKREIVRSWRPPARACPQPPDPAGRRAVASGGVDFCSV